MAEIERTDRILKYEGTIVNVYDDVMLTPDGKVAHWDYVEHKKGAAAVLPLLNEGVLRGRIPSVVMVRQYRNALGRYTLEIPAGARASSDEDTQSCAARELKEETGYWAAELKPLIRVATTVAFCNEVVDVYLATGLEKREAHPDEDEYLEVEIHHIDKLAKMIKDGEIQDSKTVAAIMTYMAGLNYRNSY